MEMGLQYDREIRARSGGSAWTGVLCTVVQVGGRWLPVRVELDDRHGWLFYGDGDRVRILPARSDS